jgi:hypothetical protein
MILRIIINRHVIVEPIVQAMKAGVMCSKKAAPVIPETVDLQLIGIVYKEDKHSVMIYSPKERCK